MATTVFSLVGRIALQGMQQVNKDISDAEKKVKEFQRELGKFGASLTRVGASLTKNLTAPIMGVTAAIGVLALKTGEYASKILSMSEATGLSTDTLQEFEHVARAAGVSSDALLSVTQKLTSRLDQIRSGTGDAAEAMDRLGISVTNTDGSYRSMEEMFPQILGELNKIENVTERNNVASKIFGRNMDDLGPVLGMTADQLASLRKEAHETGKIMGKDALVNADEFRISVANLKAEMGVLSMQIASSFIPILQEQVIPLVQDKVVPVVIAAANAIKGLAGWFGNLNPAVQNTVLVMGAVAAAIGPVMLVTGKLILGLKGLVGGIMGVLGAFKGLSAFLLTNPLGLALTAVASLIAAVVILRREHKSLEETKLFNEETKRLSDMTGELHQQVKLAKNLVTEYERLRGTKAFDPAELERLKTAHEDAVIALRNHALAMNGKEKMDDRAVENTRRRIRGEKELADETGKAEDQITDYQRAQLAKRTEEQRKANEQRKKDLASLMESHRDAIDKISMTELQLLDKEEQNELARAKTLRASEDELETIRQHYALRREKILFDEEQAFIKIAQEETKRLEEEEAEKLRIRENANAQWQYKLIQQSGDRLAILEADYARDLALAHENGADTLQVETYYENERVKLAEEINRQIAESDKKLAEERQRYITTWVNSVVGAINQLGSVMAGFARNEEKRLSKEYKQRREYINANVTDEEERAKQLSALDEEEEARRLEVQRKQAKRDKALGIFNTIIDTARAIVRSLADLGPIAGPIMAGVVGGLGIAQTAMIASQPEPFYAGAMVKGSRDGVFAQIGERNQDEVVLPLERGTEQIADKLMDALQIQSPATVAPVEYHSHYHIGTLIADDNGLKNLERKLRPHRTAEDRRTGVRT